MSRSNYYITLYDDVKSTHDQRAKIIDNANSFTLAAKTHRSSYEIVSFHL